MLGGTADPRNLTVPAGVTPLAVQPTMRLGSAPTRATGDADEVVAFASLRVSPG
jgi:hypothetical protein